MQWSSAIMSVRAGNEPSPLSEAEFQILLALADAERHGYGIMQEVALQTDGRIRMWPGTLYGAIKRMLQAGLLEESDRRPDPEMEDQRRRYYRITALGRRTTQAEAARLVELLRTAVQKRLLTRSTLLDLAR
jgi:DNA-binding PadR family transcriptional regulator